MITRLALERGPTLWLSGNDCGGRTGLSRVLCHTLRHTNPDRMLFVHDRRVYSVPEEAVILEGSGVLPIPYNTFLKMLDDSYVFCAEVFLSTNYHPSGVGSEFVSAINTEPGIVWASRIRVSVPDELRKTFGLNDDEAGAEFVWPWNVGKATVSWSRFLSVEEKDGRYRMLAHVPPHRLEGVAAGFFPEIVPGCEEVAWKHLSAEQRFFLSHIHPTTSTFGTSSNPEEDKSYRASARRIIESRQKRRRPNADPPFPPLSSLLDKELLGPAITPDKFFMREPRAAPNFTPTSEFYLGQMDVFMDRACWSDLPEEITGIILRDIAAEAFSSNWQDHLAAKRVASLRLVCRGFKRALDDELALLWQKNEEFSRRVLKTGEKHCPSPLADLRISSIPQAARDACTWARLARLRKATAAPRKQKRSPFVCGSPKVRRLTFGETWQDELSELRSLNDMVVTNEGHYV